MSNEEAIKLIVEHMAIHKMNEPRAIKISMALQKAIYSLDKNEEQIRADERERCAELLVNKYHSDSFYKESYKKDYLLLFNEKGQN